MSVLLPVRNAVDTLDEALRSVLAQADVRFEVIAVDDGSSDGSSDILADRAREDPRVRVVSTAPRGLVPALETARAAARAPLLARMDADDLMRPGRLATQRATLAEHPDWAVCGGHVRIIPRERLSAGRLRYESWLNSLADADAVERDLFVECPLAHPTWMLRADVVAQVGGYRDAGWPEDHDLLLRLRAAGWRLGTVPEVVHDWRDRPERLSRTHPSYALAAFVRCRAHHLPRLHTRARQGVVVCGAGPVGKTFARALAEVGVPLQAFLEVDPRKIGQQIHGVPVLAHDDDDPLRDFFTVAAVAGVRAREEIRSMLRKRGLVEGVDFVAVG
ncbi:MAG: glycosyltransferase [Gemmatimonadetes bacterium]|nr:glycosyltransferase [Gemmatimonadota bacterium]